MSNCAIYQRTLFGTLCNCVRGLLCGIEWWMVYVHRTHCEHPPATNEEPEPTKKRNYIRIGRSGVVVIVIVHCGCRRTTAAAHTATVSHSNILYCNNTLLLLYAISHCTLCNIVCAFTIFVIRLSIFPGPFPRLRIRIHLQLAKCHLLRSTKLGKFVGSFHISYIAQWASLRHSMRPHIFALRYIRIDGLSIIISRVALVN